MSAEDSLLDQSKDSELSKTHESGDGRSSAAEEYYKLPTIVRRRVRALKKLQYETLKLDAAYQRELFELELKYQPEHDKIFEQRRMFITGDKEPTADECDWPSDTEDEQMLCEELKEKVVVNDETNDSTSEINGIPHFWLTTMKNVFLLDDMIKEHDEPILKHLVDVRYTLQSVEEPGFTIEFVFSPNEYFSNKTLTKRYFLNFEISNDAPFEYEGPEIVRTKGVLRRFSNGKEVQAKERLQKPCKKIRFSISSILQRKDEDTQLLLEADFKLGQFLRDSLIPKGVLYFTGEISESEFEDNDDEDDDDDEGEFEEDDDSSLSAYMRITFPDKSHGRHGGHNRPKAGDKKSKENIGDQPECKQQ